MYNDELTECTIPIDDLYLDPNNPRFWNHERRRRIPDTRTTEEVIQRRVEQGIRRHDIEELQFSILRNGFLPLDRIVVRPLGSHDDKFVVVEGNRRLAALKLLRERIEEGLVAEENISDEYLDNLLGQTEELSVLVYNGSHSDDISWIFQGIRHIGGIRQWEPAQRAKLVADQFENGSSSFTETGQKFGLSARAVGRLYRSYKALEQMQADDEFGKKARNDYFSLFEEAYRNADVRKWLDWDEEEYCFRNLENLQLFYAWICPDEDDEPDQRRRIHNPKQVKCLGTLASGDHQILISKVDRHDVGIETAELAARDEKPVESWKERLLHSLDVIRSLPTEVIAENPKEYGELLAKMIAEIQQYKTMADALLGESDESE